MNDCSQLTEPMSSAVSDAQITLKALNDKVATLSAGSTRTNTLPTASTSSAHEVTVDPDRSCNVILFGIAEDKDRDVWKERVQKSLDVASHRDASVRDVFRIGSYTDGKCRPVIAKLNSVWDKRIVLSGSWRLSRNDDLKGIYINADELRDLRMCRTFDRVKFRAVANKTVFELNGVLYVDGSVVFSLVNGYVHKSASSGDQASAEVHNG